jgi:hypothetical protein
MRIVLALAATVGIYACQPSSEPSTLREGLLERIEFDLFRQGIRPVPGLASASQTQLQAILKILNDDGSPGQKGGRVEAILRR